jgi:hypothetical protein
MEEPALAGARITAALYLRDVSKGETLRLDVHQGGGTQESVEPRYMTASADGSRIFFLDQARLTPDSGAVEFRPDLYECAISEEPGTGKDKCNLTDLTPRAAEPACVAMVLGASADGSYVYFAAGGAVTPGAVSDPRCRMGTGSEEDEEQARNVYVRHEGVTRLVARLSEADSRDWRTRQLGGMSAQPVRVSPSGRWLVFMSSSSLTGYDTRDTVTGSADQEVYLYDALSARLVCASCDPTGGRPHGNGGVAALVPGWAGVLKQGRSFYQPRYLSDSGQLFFDGLGALVPDDVNGTWDVYQYEPEGIPAGPHACSSGLSGGSEVFKPARSFEVEGRVDEEGAGCVALISSGTSAQPSTFLDASETGGDVFFLTDAQLSTQDTDTAPDVYDAHECTPASPCVSVPPTQPRPCDTEGSCRTSSSPQPSVFGAPASAMFSGPGNITPPAPVRPKVRTAAQIRAERLARALKACRKKHNKHKRAICEKRAHMRYGSAKKAGRARKASKPSEASR